MEPARVEIPADFLPSEAEHLRLRWMVSKFALMRTRRVMEELNDPYREFLIALQHIMEERLGEQKEGDPGYEDYSSMVVCEDTAGQRVIYCDQEEEHGSWSSRQDAAHVLLIVEKLVEGVLTRHFLIVVWVENESRWAPLYPKFWDENMQDVPQPGYAFAVLNEYSRGPLLVAPRISEVLGILTRP